MKELAPIGTYEVLELKYNTYAINYIPVLTFTEIRK